MLPVTGSCSKKLQNHAASAEAPSVDQGPCPRSYPLSGQRAVAVASKPGKRMFNSLAANFVSISWPYLSLCCISKLCLSACSGLCSYGTARPGGLG